MKLSIVTTLYRCGPYIEAFYQRASAAAQQLTNDYEIIFVNDGSPDDSLDCAIHFAQIDSKVIVVDLSRNFGHHKAMMTGLAQARGERVFLIDSDLEEEPEWLLPFAEQMNREHCDVVYGVQRHRKGGIVERWTGQLFYKIFRMLTRLTLPENIVTARLMTRRYVEALLRFDEREVFLAGLWLITGFEQRPQTVKKLNTSKTTYTYRHRMSVLVNSITSFSNAPLIGIFYVGIIILFGACAYIAYLISHRLFVTSTLSGWTSVIASIWLLGGLIISFIGVVGIYLSKIFSETKRRPYTIIRQIYGKQPNVRTIDGDC
jgi:putative glycosyltransferase